MKKIIVCFSILLALVVASGFGQDLGQKVYKEVTINGEIVKKWLKVTGIEDYDERGKSLYEKDTDGFSQYEYDDKGNEIHWVSLAFVSESALPLKASGRGWAGLIIGFYI